MRCLTVISTLMVLEMFLSNCFKSSTKWFMERLYIYYEFGHTMCVAHIWWAYKLKYHYLIYMLNAACWHERSTQKMIIRGVFQKTRRNSKIRSLNLIGEVLQKQMFQCASEVPTILVLSFCLFCSRCVLWLQNNCWLVSWGPFLLFQSQHHKIFCAKHLIC